jgi:hypothetical protein
MKSGELMASKSAKMQNSEFDNGQLSRPLFRVFGCPMDNISQEELLCHPAALSLRAARLA